MPLPVYLSQGMISVYGQGSVWGMFQDNRNNSNPFNQYIQFGVVDQINTVPASLAIGNSVMYDVRDVIAPIFYNNTQFSILNGNKVIAVEYVYNIVIPPAP